MTATGDFGYTPGLLGFFVDRYMLDGTFAGWTPVAWGFMPRPSGPVVTMSHDGPPTMTWWASLDAAEIGLAALAGRVRDEIASVQISRILTRRFTGAVKGPLVLPPSAAEVVGACRADSRLTAWQAQPYRVGGSE